jgi:hypothetical protein
MKGKPAWQDSIQDTQEARDTYKIADEYQTMFSRAFLKMTRDLITPEIERDFKAAWKSDSVSKIMDTIPYFTVGEMDEVEAWKKYTDGLSKAYLTIIQAAGDDSTRIMNKDFKTNFEFNITDTEKEAEVQKSMADVRAAAEGMTVGVNPRVAEWTRDRGLELVKQSITKQQKRVVSDIIQNALEKGGRPTNALKDIKANIGLTERDYKATLKRKQMHLDAGLSPEKAEELTDKYRDKLLGARAERIARTETIQAQAQGRKEAWINAQNAGELPKVKRRWISAPPSPNPNRPCEICLDLDGKEATLDGTYDSLEGPIDGPTAHPSCLPAESIVLASGISATSERAYAGDVITITTALGHKLTCTPNHPILGPGGWLSANSFKVGDQIVSSSGSDWISSFINRDYDDRPSSIHEKTKAFGKSGQMSSIPVPTTTEDFHGDGIQSEIAIIRTYGKLWNHMNAPFSEQIKKELFIRGAKLPSTLNRRSTFAELLKSRLSSLCCQICRPRIFSMLFGRSLSHHESVGVQGISDVDIPIVKDSSDLRSGDSKGFSDRILGLSGCVTLDNVVSVDVQRFSGHVFNLQTEFSWYISQGLISHNCRCSEILVKA